MRLKRFLRYRALQRLGLGAFSAFFALQRLTALLSRPRSLFFAFFQA